MAPLRDPQLERFAQALAGNLANGIRPSAAADEAADTAGYKGRSRASNARKRARRPDVKARVAELMRPAQERAERQVEVSVEWARSRLTAIAGPELGTRKTKVSDQIAAIKLLAEIEGWKAPEKQDMVVTVRGGLPE